MIFKNIIGYILIPEYLLLLISLDLLACQDFLTFKEFF